MLDALLQHPHDAAAAAARAIRRLLAPRMGLASAGPGGEPAAAPPSAAVLASRCRSHGEATPARCS